MKLALAICAALACACSARAHPVAQGAMEIMIFDSGKIELRARVSPEEVFVANALASSPSASLDQAYEQHGDYLLRHLRVFADGQELTGVRVGFTPPRAGAGTAHAVYDFLFQAPHTPRSMRIEQNVLHEFDYAPGNRWEATYIVRVRDRTHRIVDAALLTSRAPLDFSSGDATAKWRTAVDYVRHGITHILTGYDHLLFICALALAVMRFWELFKIIAAFTLAHTITLTLSVLDIVRLPSQIVEPMIAASIVFVALQNAVWPERSHGATRLGVAFFFGLFHGLGFAGGLLDAMSGLPGVAVSLAILSFSAGVEIGHQCVVLPLFGLTKLIRAWRHGRDAAAADRAWILRCGSTIICAAGIFYLVAALSQISLRSGR